MDIETPLLKDKFHDIFGRYGATRLFTRDGSTFDELEAFTKADGVVVTRSRRDGIFRLYDEEARDIRLFRVSDLNQAERANSFDELFEMLLWRLKQQDALPFGADLYVVGSYIDDHWQFDLELIAYTLTRLGDQPMPDHLIRELCLKLVA
ncbi:MULTISPECIES: hypothetical protein [Exiguobacterium]|uniref:hypothetical protein n=1 Tax=Exiguobacterium TaxID=33986 RepID=UPI000877846D|nr:MULTISPECIES: hypothetical protein [Exiguobacterium]TCI36208.1 hypothetical protein EVJ29_06835 [Exiguobacterium sp. SH4S7]TCI48263.1 hypothetical protein EVJ31_04280 [Exiguobacterium sp. SH5S32]TCI55149.1 hypothetical protein EVJ25_04270 [Exiguobacterium sp. SH1S4]TCI57439.1 hypothetical protein EVJ24_01275 [Exiguobacterium sp. SH1S21]TCI64088.1 hypothetical protein EVJ26_06755 [Exiguobacterium sp. SH3S1]